ncbi:Hpt domain-containing protein [Thalassotalea psychrophila]|uniref:Hpt domain-containing protein n=1 Tax=Thalassotalea psychrophila TaxID=3065647 RepID=A0ABY9TTL8_9GAMM|nr:Hpt domain-containing protein [Colwelliaceae bacterium SQ149]
MEFLDKELIKQYMDVLGSEVFNQTVDLYIEQSEIYLNQLRDAIKNQDYTLWQESCHILKSASGNTGLKQVFAKAGNAEYSKQEFVLLAKDLDELQELNKISIEQIQKWLA